MEKAGGRRDEPGLRRWPGTVRAQRGSAGRLVVPGDWAGKHGTGRAKKKSVSGLEEKRALIEPAHPELSVARQCELLGLARSSSYYQPVPESEEHLLLMRLLDEQDTRTPFYGMGKMTAWLRTQGHEVNHKRVGRLLRQMGLMAVYAGPRLSQPAERAVRYP